MRVLWSAEGPLSAGEVRDLVAAGDVGPPAFTTVMTVLSRLQVKGRVDRSVSADGTLEFAAAQSESAHAVDGMIAALVAASDRGAALLQFAGALDPRDAALLRQVLDGGDAGPVG
jgi:predicted transcriptional regulator